MRTQVASNVRVVDCYASSNGGAFYLKQDASLMLANDSRVERCVAGKSGGAISGAWDGATVALRDGVTIEACSAALYGGALHLKQAVLDMRNTTIVGCVCGLSGSQCPSAYVSVSRGVPRGAGGDIASKCVEAQTHISLPPPLSRRERGCAPTSKSYCAQAAVSCSVGSPSGRSSTGRSLTATLWGGTVAVRAPTFR